MNEFGRRLKLLRERKNLSYNDLAEAVGSTKSLIWRYEHGKSEPGLSALNALADYFGVTIDWLAGNGDFNTIQYTNKKEYFRAINKAIQEGVSPEKLEQMIDVYKK